MASYLRTIVFSFVLSITFSNAIAYTYVCNPQRYKDHGLDMSMFPFCDKSLHFSVRAKYLVDSMTVGEKVKQLGHRAAGVGRLGIPFYNWWSEILHGVSGVGGGSNFNGHVKGATSFPTPISSTASFNKTLWRTIGETISTEARAMRNFNQAGLTFWSPVINVVRDPRWGRTLETNGEDPFVTGVYAINFVRGLQDMPTPYHGDPNARPLKVAGCCKHYAAYDLENWKNFKGEDSVRFSFNANVTEQDMVETFLHPFEMCVKEGDVGSVMCSYNQVNGIPTCADSRLLAGTIRGEWNLHGYIVSDCDSVQVMHNNQRWLNDDPEDAVAQALTAGLDLDCGAFFPKFLGSALKKGLIKESDIDKALVHNYVMLLRLGWFDGHQEFDSLSDKDVCSPEHIELARDAARQGMVLLKNNHGLPLDPSKHKKIAVVGPHAHATKVMLGNYEGIPCGYVSPTDGLKKYATEVVCAKGCDGVACKRDSYIWGAVRAAESADATIIVAGIDLSIEAEGRDRADLDLPGFQNQMIRMVSSVAKGPVILVLFSAGGLDISDYVNPRSPNGKHIDAILWAGYPGEQGGQAVADIIYGRYNPAGRLPVSWYTDDYIWGLPMTSMRLRADEALGYPGRTYKFYDGPVLFPFGHGLSYSSFSYRLVSEQLSVTKKLEVNQHCQNLHYRDDAYVPPCHAGLVSDLNCDDDISIDIEVTNTKDVDGEDVVMVFSRASDGILGVPIKQLVAFERVFVPAKGSKIVSFSLSSCKALNIITETAYNVLPSGEHTIIVGVQQSTKFPVAESHSIQFPFHVYFRK